MGLLHTRPPVLDFVPMADILARFHVDCSDPVRPVVSVNGETVPPIKRVSMDWKPGDVPHLYLELLGEGEIEGQGIVVQQVEGAPADLVTVLNEFFDAIDPKTFEDEILGEFSGFGDDVTTGQAAVNVLKRWVKAAHNGQ